MKNVVVIGGGGHGKVIQDLIRSIPELRLLAVLDDKYGELRKTVNELLLGSIRYVPSFLMTYDPIYFVIAIGHNETRKKLVARLGLQSKHYISLIHPTAVMSPSAVIGCGSVVMANAVVQADSIIGSHSIINTGAIVEHDIITGDYVHVCPRATLTGAVRVEEGAMIGAGATVIPGRCIREWSVVGAGSTVISEIPSFSTFVGSPARALHKKVKV